VEAMPSASRNLFRAALVIFVITIVIGILNGTDLWEQWWGEVPRNTLLTHVHAGTLGWISLSVFGGAIWMIGGRNAEAGAMAAYAIIAISLYVLAFWSVDLTEPTRIQRPIGGTLAFIAMAWVLIWAWRHMTGRPWDVARFGMLLALIFLVFGAVLGILLGLQLADVEVVAPAETGRFAESHPGAMVAGFVVLAALALIEWLIQERPPGLKEGWRGWLGTIQMLLLFVAGLIFVAGGLAANEDLLGLAIPFQVLGALVLLARHGGRLAPAEWTREPSNKFVRMPIIGLVAVVALIVYVINEIMGGREFSELFGPGLALDHLNFIMVITNLVFGMLALASVVSNAANSVIFWGTNIGVAGFAIGLISENNALIRVFTPILGLTLLYGIYVYSTAPEREPSQTLKA
jgi:hypothetical protein